MWSRRRRTRRVKIEPEATAFSGEQGTGAPKLRTTYVVVEAAS
jgi:hypothetical protein